MVDNPQFTPEQAKAVLDDNPGISMMDLARRCFVSRNTIYRWRDNGWKDLRAANAEKRKKKSKVKVEVKSAEDRKAEMVKRAVGDANISLKQQILNEEVTKALALSDDNLIRDANRQVMVTCMAVLKEIGNQGHTLVKSHPQQIASLIAAVTAAVHGATKSWESVVDVLRRLAPPEVVAMAEKAAADQADPPPDEEQIERLPEDPLVDEFTQMLETAKQRQH